MNIFLFHSNNKIKSTKYYKEKPYEYYKNYKKRKKYLTGSIINYIFSSNNYVYSLFMWKYKPKPQPKSTQQILEKILYWEPKDSNGCILDEAYCIESLPSDFWNSPVDINTTYDTFKRTFGVE